MVQRTLIRPPAARLGAISAQERQYVIDQSPVSGQYDKTVDRDSAALQNLFEPIVRQMIGEAAHTDAR